MRLLWLLLMILMVGEALAKPPYVWVREVEQTVEYQRDREYFLDDGPSLNWGQTFGYGEELTRWPEKTLSFEAKVKWTQPEWGVPNWARELHEPESGFLGPDFPGAAEVYSYLWKLNQEEYAPHRVAVEFEQSTYRREYRVTVLEWGERLELEGPTPKPVQAATGSVEVGPTSPGRIIMTVVPHVPLESSDKRIQVGGIHLGMKGQQVMETDGAQDPQVKVEYRADRGTVTKLEAPFLRLGGRELSLEDSRERVAKTFRDSGFEYDLQTGLDRFSNGRVVGYVSHNEVGIESFVAFGGQDQRAMDPRIAWEGPGLTIGGWSLLTDLEEFKWLGEANRVHSRGKDSVLCYHQDECEGDPLKPVDLHVTVREGRVVRLRGAQIEQDGRILSHSWHAMPPRHSVEQLKETFWALHKDLDRPAVTKGGPVHVMYCPDLELSIWIYPDGRRQFILTEKDLPNLCIDPNFP